MSLLQIIYIVLTAAVVGVMLVELFRERSWRNQLAYAVILIPLVLRVLQIK